MIGIVVFVVVIALLIIFNFPRTSSRQQNRGRRPNDYTHSNSIFYDPGIHDNHHHHHHGDFSNHHHSHHGGFDSGGGHHGGFDGGGGGDAGIGGHH
jgi:ABC-type nickel/cobalt efflux system permease component RcnA